MARKKKPTIEDITQEMIRNNPEQVIEIHDRPPLLSGLLPGDSNKLLREQIINTGRVQRGKQELRVLVRPNGSGDHEVMAMGAVSRDPGLTQDQIDTVQDFVTTLTKPQDQKIKQLWQIYYNEGIINNAVNKVAAILSGGGSFKVRKAKKGRKTTALETLEAILFEWVTNLNDSGVDGVITGSRGLQAVTHQAVRQALVEGDWFGRQVWVKHEVPGYGTFSLPMNIQTISSRYMEPFKDLAASASSAELFYWVPPVEFVNQISKPANKEVRDIIRKFIPKDVQSQLIKDKKALIDPILLLHVKHRGQDNNPFGESLISCALQAIAYKRAIDNLDLVTMQNLINRLTIIMIGSDDPNSPLFKQEVATYRAQLMQEFFEDPGPNMTIVWAGHDVKVEDVGAHTQVMSLDERHKLAIGKVKDAIGLPEALLTGTTSDGKAAGWAANLGTSAQLEELQNAFAKSWTSIGKRIALENGFTDIDLVFEFDKGLLIDRMEEQVQTRLDYTAGVSSIFDLIQSRGKDPDAVYLRKCHEKGLDPETATWEEAFMPPQGLAGQSDALTDGAPGKGRTPDSTLGKPKPRKTEDKTTTENK